MNNFDVTVELFLNQFVGRHLWLDRMIGLTHATNLLQGGVMVLLILLLLFDRNRPGQLRKGFELLVGSVFFSVFAVLTARGLALSLPFRARPIAEPSLHFRLPACESLVLINWSAFPSDHAVLFFALAAAILMVSKRAGALAFAWVIAGVCFPLLYIGVHWPTDIIAGAILGMSFAQIARIPVIREFVRRTIQRNIKANAARHPGGNVRARTMNVLRPADQKLHPTLKCAGGTKRPAIRIWMGALQNGWIRTRQKRRRFGVGDALVLSRSFASDY